MSHNNTGSNNGTSDPVFYLRRMQLSGFRAYRAPLELELTDGPGLTVIVGSNGLGKSTLFDAMEWALTGQLTRLHGHGAKQKEMAQAIGAQPEVSLWFDDGSSVRRTRQQVLLRQGEGTGLAEQAGEAALMRHLVRSQWHALDNLADCLHLTHFLGQSTRQLFIHKDGKERFNHLQGPSGLQTLWQIEQTLGRKQTDNAFKTLHERFSNQHQAAQQALQRATTLWQQLAAQRALGQAAAALSPDALAAECAKLEQELVTGFGWVLPELDGSEATTPETRLARQHQFLLQLERELGEQGLGEPDADGADLNRAASVNPALPHVRLLAERAACAAQLAETSRQLAEKQQQWQSAQLAADAVSAALAQITAALTVDDCQCPLCHTQFAESGRLLALAQQAGAAPAQKMQALDAECRALAERQAQQRQQWEQVQAKMQAMLRRVALLRERQQVLVLGRQQYASASQLLRLEQEWADMCQAQQLEPGAAAEPLLAQLAAKVAAADAELARLSTVQRQRDALCQRLSERNDRIRHDIGLPLNRSIGQYCAALMSDRKFDLALDTVASSASAQALLSFQAEADGARRNPLLYLSEGQLSAVNLCLLFGAASTWPWSRWPALLLDDPLHHNDTIHTAAFIDLVRNLIQYQGYQIVLSTHDMEQAGYFLRKCANANIAARYWHLYGKSADGVLLQGG